MGGRLAALARGGALGQTWGTLTDAVGVGFSVHQHGGREAAGRDPRADAVTASLARLAAPAADDGRPPLLFDLETTGLGRDAVPFLVGLGGFEAGGTAWVRQWQLDRPEGERAMWCDVLDALRGEPAGTRLLTYNGASFDRTIVRLRLRRLGMWDGAVARRFEADHVDLLPVCRRLWRDVLPDLRLVTLEREILGAARHGDPGGAEIAALGQAWIGGRRDDTTAAGMVAARRHNADDLLGLASLSVACARAIGAPGELGEALGVVRHLARHGALDELTAVVDAWVTRALDGGGFGIDLLLHGVRALRRGGEHGRAHGLLQAICARHRGHPEATLRLAMDLEHRLRRADLALSCLRTLADPCPHRLARLERKQGARVRAIAVDPAVTVVPVATVPVAAHPSVVAATAATPTAAAAHVPARPELPGAWRARVARTTARRAPAV